MRDPLREIPPDLGLYCMLLCCDLVYVPELPDRQHQSGGLAISRVLVRILAGKAEKLSTASLTQLL